MGRFSPDVTGAAEVDGERYDIALVGGRNVLSRLRPLGRVVQYDWGEVLVVEGRLSHARVICKDARASRIFAHVVPHRYSAPRIDRETAFNLARDAYLADARDPTRRMDQLEDRGESDVAFHFGALDQILIEQGVAPGRLPYVVDKFDGTFWNLPWDEYEFLKLTETDKT